MNDKKTDERIVRQLERGESGLVCTPCSHDVLHHKPSEDRKTMTCQVVLPDGSLCGCTRDIPKFFLPGIFDHWAKEL